ncbi:DUF4232 domain-containing protein [Nocardioides lianchengensis]|uniref:DUF4232 domain-containing protein n=1 Tax=Nocardioides lianchengensis TaxID=1045774 RepID=A0A1G7AGQ1_9ACTN|nr:DUF4232 domain-containing protein [Nocardioides lianchengensis]NYG13585.1 hypothetical protein [Nocardioides lianchengensis]SDE13910.1 Protein of unknown function [Nocardioides lianchengensis]
MTTRRSARGALITLVLAALLAPLGCSTTEPADLAGGPQVADGATAAVPERQSPPVEPAPSAAPATSAPPTPVATEVRRVSNCLSDALGEVSQRERVLPDRMNAAGTSPLMATDVTVVNVSAEACFLSGWPGVTLIGDGLAHSSVEGEPAPAADHETVPQQRVENLAGDAPAIELPPGGSTSFSVLYDGVVCLEPVWRMDLQVVGDPRPIEVARTQICNSDPVQVGPFGTVVDAE